MKLVLIGYMASGKSLIARYLSDKLGVVYIDLDDYIVKKEGQTIKEIIKNKGEIYFRMVENKYLKEVLNKKNDFILATGGGTPCYANNMHLIKDKAKSVYLKASVNTLSERLLNESKNRPLLSNIKKEDLKEFIAKHLFERNNYYNKANKTITVDNKSVKDIINEITTIFYSK